jgi:hypothetical protein
MYGIPDLRNCDGTSDSWASARPVGYRRGAPTEAAPSADLSATEAWDGPSGPTGGHESRCHVALAIIFEASPPGIAPNRLTPTSRSWPCAHWLCGAPVRALSPSGGVPICEVIFVDPSRRFDDGAGRPARSAPADPTLVRDRASSATRCNLVAGFWPRVCDRRGWRLGDVLSFHEHRGFGRSCSASRGIMLRDGCNEMFHGRRPRLQAVEHVADP